VRPRLAFYDLDGTLVSSNVVTQYAYFLRRHARGRLKFVKLIASLPLYIALDWYSRRLFNEVFYAEYRGMSMEWLRSQASGLFDEVIRPAIYPNAEALVSAAREGGFETVLVTGSLDFCIEPVLRHFGFDHAIANRMEARDGVATGRILPPLIAEQEKVAAMKRLVRERGADPGECRAYSDSMSDLPMLECVGRPAAVNPGRRLRRIARRRGWPVIDLRGGAACFDKM
jgi:HAD superfamily hydrolase (TIGR01490 family)